MQTTFPELASSMGKVIPMAGAMQLSQEELFGAMATLTGVTGTTAEVSTQLRGVLQGLIKPTDGMSASLKKMGFENGTSAIETLGLKGTLDKLKESVGGSDAELIKMFGSVEAGTAVLALTGSQADNFTAKTEAMAKAAGSTTKAFKIQQATVDAMMKKMNASFDVVMITLGEQLLPMFNKFLNWVILHMPEIQAFIDSAIKVAADVMQSLSNLINDVLIPKFQKIIDIVKDIADNIFPSMGDGSFDLEETVKSLVTKGLDILIGALAWVRDNMPLVKGAIKGVTTVWLIQKGVLLAHNIVMAAHKVAQLASIVLNGTEASTTGLATAALIIHKAALVAGTAAQWLFNAAMTANPIAIVVVALATLGAGIALVVTHWKDIVTWIEKAWNWLTKWNGEPAEDKNTTVTTTFRSEGSVGARPGEGYNANGTDNWRGGLSWVGEEGPELVNLPKGSQVVPNKESMAMTNNKGLTLTIGTFVNNGKEDIEELAEELEFYRKKKSIARG